VQQYLDNIEEEQKRDVNEKISQLLKNFNDLSNVLTSRIPIIELFLKFHHEAEHLTNLFNNFEHSLKTQKNSDVFHYIDTVWEKIQSQFSLLKTLQKLFASETTKVCFILVLLTRMFSSYRLNGRYSTCFSKLFTIMPIKKLKQESFHQFFADFLFFWNFAIISSKSRKEKEIFFFRIERMR
jgi:hypothetical protein